MKTVSVSELKANLSRFLREVRRGGEIQILDRGIPVARLSASGRSAPASADDEHRRRLISAGILRAGSGNAAAILKRPPLKLPGGLGTALDEERADRI